MSETFVSASRCVQTEVGHRAYDDIHVVTMSTFSYKLIALYAYVVALPAPKSIGTDKDESTRKPKPELAGVVRKHRGKQPNKAERGVYNTKTTRK